MRRACTTFFDEECTNIIGQKQELDGMKAIIYREALLFYMYRQQKMRIVNIVARRVSYNRVVRLVLLILLLSDSSDDRQIYTQYSLNPTRRSLPICPVHSSPCAVLLCRRSGDMTQRMRSADPVHRDMRKALNREQHPFIRLFFRLYYIYKYSGHPLL